MMDLYIIGAGDVGGFIAYHYHVMGDYSIKGFIDDNPTKVGEEIYGIPVVGTTDYLLDLKQSFAVVIAISTPKHKRIIYEKLKNSSNISFPNFIHPKAWIGEKVKIGKGCIVYPGVSINFEGELKDFIIINMNAAIGHNCFFDNYSTISPGVGCGGFTSLGEGTFLGINSCTIQSVTIGKNVKVGAGAVVIKDIPDNSTVIGNPGTVI